MRILITCHTYYPNNDGVQFVTQYLAEGLKSKGHEVTIVTNLYKDRCSKVEELHNGIKIYRVNVGTKHTIHYGNKKEYVDFIKKLCNENDIMINVCTQCATTDFLLNSLNDIKIPKVLYLHSIWDFKYNKENFKSFKTILGKLFANVRWRLYYLSNKSNFKKYNLVTQLHKMDYTNKFFEKKFGIKSVVIENAAEDVFFNDEVDNDIVLPDKYIVNVSNYLKRKNQEKCVELFLKADIPSDFELILIGSKKNSYYDKIVKMYKESNTNKKISFLYEVPRKDISTYVKKATLYMMTSKWEAFPISLTESLAAKTPFLSSNVGIVKYLPGGVVCNSDEEYIYWLEELTKNDEIREKYAELGYLEAKDKYSVKSKVDQLEKELLKLI